MNVNIDEFVVHYTLECLEKDILKNKEQFLEFEEDTIKELDNLKEETKKLREEDSGLTGTINTLIHLVEDLMQDLKETKVELTKTKLANIKQEIVVRTLHNMTEFNAHDMFVDTFTDASNIDWDISTRGVWLADTLSIGRTTASMVKVFQNQAPEMSLISANGSDDRALSQSFQLDKDHDVEKISIYATKHNASTWMPLKVTIREANGGTVISSGTVEVSRANGWVDVNMDIIRLTQYKDYYIDVRTDDTYGYRIGVDKAADRYFAGTSYNLFNGVWTDNNFDIGFKVWCFAADDENDATLVTEKRTLATMPTSIVFEREDVSISGSINYHVSRDDGQHWKILQPGIETNLNDLPEGKDLRIKAYLTGNSRVDAWGYVIKRSET